VLTWLARLIVRTYPSAWRERYEAEVVELVDAAPVRLRDLGDLLHGLLVERWRELVTADHAPRRTQVLLGLLGPVVVLTVVLSSTGLGRMLKTGSGPWPPQWVETGEWTVVALFLIIGVGRMRRLFQRVPAPPGLTLLTALAWLSLMVVAAEWGNLMRFDLTADALPIPVSWRRLLLFCLVGTSLTRDLWPDTSILDAIDQRDAYHEQLRLARAWVEGCHTTMANGLPAPLAEAEAQVEHLNRELERATAELAGKGYHARFQSRSL